MLVTSNGGVESLTEHGGMTDSLDSLAEGASKATTSFTGDRKWHFFTVGGRRGKKEKKRKDNFFIAGMRSSNRRRWGERAKRRRGGVALSFTEGGRYFLHRRDLGELEHTRRQNKEFIAEVIWTVNFEWDVQFRIKSKWEDEILDALEVWNPPHYPITVIDANYYLLSPKQ